MKNILSLVILMLFFAPIIKNNSSLALELNQFKEKLDIHSPSNLTDINKSQDLLKSDCECVILQSTYGIPDQNYSDSILVDSCAAVYDDLFIDSCSGRLFWTIGISIDEASNCRTSPILDKDDSIFCDRCFEMEKSIRIKSLNFDSTTTRLKFLLNKDYFQKKYSKVITKEDVYPEYPEFKDYLTSLEKEFDLFPKYRGSNNSIEFYFKEYVNLHDFLETAFNRNYVDDFFINFFTILTSVNNEVNDSEVKAYYSNGTLQVNSNSEYLKSIEAYDLYGNKINSDNSINSLNYNININLNSGVYFLLINDKQIIKISITE